MQKTLPIILGLVVVLGIIALLAWPDDTGRKIASTRKPGVDTLDVAKPVITGQQSKDMAAVLEALKVWDSRYKSSAGTITEPVYVNKDIANPYLSTEPAYDDYFSKGAILHMLKRYMDTLNSLKVENSTDIGVRNELNAFYNKLRNEPDPVTVTIVNRSGGPLQYGESAINPGASLSVMVNSRKLGEAEIQEGAFNFSNEPFVYNPGLQSEPSWDTAAFSWKATGRSTYLLEVLR